MQKIKQNDTRNMGKNSHVVRRNARLKNMRALAKRSQGESKFMR